MSAFLAKVGTWFGKYVMTYLIRYVTDHVTAWLERRRASKEQDAKDEASKQPYDEAVQNGTHEEIEQATEDRLNG